MTTQTIYIAARLTVPALPSSPQARARRAHATRTLARWAAGATLAAVLGVLAPTLDRWVA